MDARGGEPTLEDLGQGSWAYLQPDGSWGYSNAGLVTDGEACLLVDTLFDLAHTERMLARMRDACPAARSIGTVVNTHANGDHCYGNQLVPEARVVASKASLARWNSSSGLCTQIADRSVKWRTPAATAALSAARSPMPGAPSVGTACGC